ncbi:MAG: hypothetical protein WDA24_01615 [Tissierellales bacterium]
MILHATVVIFDMIPLIKSGKKKEVILYASIIMISLVLGFLYALGIDIPSPVPYFEKLVMLIK